MNTRTARLGRKGVLATRSAELAQHIHLAPRLVRVVFAETLRRQQIKRLKATETESALYASYYDVMFRQIDDMRRRMFPKPIPDTFKAAPKPTPTFTVHAWQKYHSEPTPYAPFSDAVARRANPEQAEHLRRFYA